MCIYDSMDDKRFKVDTGSLKTILKVRKVIENIKKEPYNGIILS